VRILFHSNAPWAGTGYGVQAGIWTRKLAELGHDVAVSSFYGHLGGMTKWEGITVYPGGQHSYGGDIIGKHADHWKADLVIALMDQWALPKTTLSGRHVAFWIPVDCSPLSTRDADGLREAKEAGVKVHLLALSRFAQKQLKEVGYDSMYVPHGINTKTLWVPPADKKAAREALGLDDRFIIFTDAANLSHDRKGYAELFAAFSRFRAKHPDALLMCHTLQTTSSGLDLPYVAARMGVLDGIAWTDQYMLTAGMIRAETLRSNYGIADLYAGASLAEGFGLPHLQALACGVPVVSTRGTGEDERGPGKHGAGGWGSSMHEVVGPVAYEVKSEPYWRPGHDAWWDKPLIGELVKAFEKAYKRDGPYQAKCAASRAHAQQYDVDVVLEKYWIPALARIEATL
jgi:glycosyltransferase involved in cell wall biosynthesis